jgi:hypothetical protein
MRKLFLALILVVFGFATPVFAQDISGDYEATGTFPNGKAYGGAVKIVPFGTAHAMLWKLDNGPGYQGLALRQGDVLGSAYASKGVPFGLVVYRIAGGTLDGEWISTGDVKAELGRETLQGPEKLGGTYKITLGQNRDGTTNYTGEVIIKPYGHTYLVAWMVPNLAYVGRGVRIGDVLVVAYGRGEGSNAQQRPGVVAYQIEDADNMVGVWADAGTEQTGTENLRRRAQ